MNQMTNNSLLNDSRSSSLNYQIDPASLKLQPQNSGSSQFMIRSFSKQSASDYRNGRFRNDESILKAFEDSRMLVEMSINHSLGTNIQRSIQPSENSDIFNMNLPFLRDNSDNQDTTNDVSTTYRNHTFNMRNIKNSAKNLSRLSLSKSQSRSRSKDKDKNKQKRQDPLMDVQGKQSAHIHQHLEQMQNKIHEDNSVDLNGNEYDGNNNRIQSRSKYSNASKSGSKEKSNVNKNSRRPPYQQQLLNKSRQIEDQKSKSRSQTRELIKNLLLRDPSQEKMQKIVPIYERSNEFLRKKNEKIAKLRQIKQQLEEEEEKKLFEEIESRRSKSRSSNSRLSYMSGTQTSMRSSSKGGSPFREKSRHKYEQDQLINLIFHPQISKNSSKLIKNKRENDGFKYIRELNQVVYDPQRHANIQDRFKEHEEYSKILQELLTEKVIQQETPFKPQIYNKKI
ncbi:UNKNOWN [Stylonychia lemnae]|uniref:Uncharacterized protein n=1 Tax=Stylonychia lemnae TaxID=5949 RepID=A0A078ANV1_STYLE|nr:UNKNOWN [Stylonychia lemnae]|eukprot:CDW82982.1 UNKNOWN [Stylonychia lemnae]